MLHDCKEHVRMVGYSHCTQVTVKCFLSGLCLMGLVAHLASALSFLLPAAWLCGKHDGNGNGQSLTQCQLCRSWPRLSEPADTQSRSEMSWPMRLPTAPLESESPSGRKGNGMGSVEAAAFSLPSAQARFSALKHGTGWAQSSDV